ncbi:MAG: Fic family protein [Chitinophagaceae bacterium]|nr:Fic family protein [Chitinophagaceae bacterium]
MSQKFTDIIEYVLNNKGCSSSEIYTAFANSYSLATIKRILKQLVADGVMEKTGSAKSTRYSIPASYQVLQTVDIAAYYQKDIDERKINNSFNFSLMRNILPQMKVFTQKEMESLEQIHERFIKNSSRLSQFEYGKEMERLAIDLSWKSSQIEGNTYSLLETEQLLKEKKTAAGKTKDEATMLLNHKRAIDFVTEQPDYMYPMSISKLEDLHSILINELAISRNIRTNPVGISGTNYVPLFNEHQIREALQDMCELVNNKENVFEKAMLTLLLISYIQPFVDGNKRTARIACNAILMHFKYCPLSFRTVDSTDYKKAILLFYEINNLSAFKKLFMEQYEFAVNTYF